MATSRWKSSLANIEARMRRSLGIAGPIDLTLAEPPILQPVVLADDLTRPGCASDYRGRRYSLTFDVGTILAGAFGGWGMFTDCPTGLVVDSFSLTCSAVGAVSTEMMGVFLLAPSQIAAHPFPLTVFRSGWMIDPNGGPSDVAPSFSGQNNLIPVTGQRISQFGIRSDARPWHAPLEVWLPFQGALMIGNFNAAVNDIRLLGTVRGRVF